jgi:diacylglycerol kinase family enzyme
MRYVDAVEVKHGEGLKEKLTSINVVTWGMARDAAETAESMRALGPARYDIAGLWHILTGKANFGTIGVSNNLRGKIEEETKDYLMMFAQNTRCSGRAFAFTPLAQLDDGEFDVCVCEKGGAMHTKALFDATKTGGGHVEDGSVAYVKAKRLTLRTATPEPVGIDGEVTVLTPIQLTCLQGAFLTFV